MIDSLAKLLEPLAEGEFLASVWGRDFCYVRGGAGKFAGLMPWARLNEILRRHRLDYPRLRLVRDGETLAASACLRYNAPRRGRQPIPRLKPADLLAQLRRGATLVLDAVDELSAPAEELAAALEHQFRESVQINCYAGFRTTHGFDLHFDRHDVFILQVAGRKRWRVYGETRPHPVADDIEPAAKPAGPPLWEGVLEDGDVLYMPRGWWHVAEPLDEPTLHLTVGVHKRTGLDFMKWLTQRLRALFVNWLDWTESADLPGGCPMIGGATEFDDKPGPVRDMLAGGQRAWIDTLRRAVRQAVEAGQLVEAADPEQVAFEMFGIALVVHHHRRLLGYPKARERALAALDALFERYAASRKPLRTASR